MPERFAACEYDLLHVLSAENLAHLCTKTLPRPALELLGTRLELKFNPTSETIILVRKLVLGIMLIILGDTAVQIEPLSYIRLLHYSFHGLHTRLAGASLFMLLEERSSSWVVAGSYENAAMIPPTN
jgi:hypothetical protein